MGCADSRESETSFSEIERCVLKELFRQLSGQQTLTAVLPYDFISQLINGCELLVKGSVKLIRRYWPCLDFASFCNLVAHFTKPRCFTQNQQVRNCSNTQLLMKIAKLALMDDGDDGKKNSEAGQQTFNIQEFETFLQIIRFLITQQEEVNYLQQEHLQTLTAQIFASKSRITQGGSVKNNSREQQNKHLSLQQNLFRIRFKSLFPQSDILIRKAFYRLFFHPLSAKLDCIPKLMLSQFSAPPELAQSDLTFLCLSVNLLQFTKQLDQVYSAAGQNFKFSDFAQHLVSANGAATLLKLVISENEAPNTVHQLYLITLYQFKNGEQLITNQNSYILQQPQPQFSLPQSLHNEITVLNSPQTQTDTAKQALLQPPVQNSGASEAKCQDRIGFGVHKRRNDGLYLLWIDQDSTKCMVPTSQRNFGKKSVTQSGTLQKIEMWRFRVDLDELLQNDVFGFLKEKNQTPNQTISTLDDRRNKHSQNDLGYESDEQYNEIAQIWKQTQSFKSETMLSPTSRMCTGNYFGEDEKIPQRTSIRENQDRLSVGKMDDEQVVSVRQLRVQYGEKGIGLCSPKNRNTAPHSTANRGGGAVYTQRSLQTFLELQ